MSDIIKLTIAIPTYNRPFKVVQRLNEIYKQIILHDLSNEIEILIIDNNSIESVSDVINSSFTRESLSNLRIIRNDVNIGLCANVCRCFEHAKGIWTWTLGDDDSILDGALQHIIKKISSLDQLGEVVGIHFGTTLFSNPENLDFHKIEDYWKHLATPEVFGNALFISSCVTNTGVFKDNMRIALNLCSSYAPIIAIYSYALSKGAKVCIDDKMVVAWFLPPVSDRWNWAPVVSGLSVLAEVPGCEYVISKFIRNGISHHLPKPFIITMIKFIIQSDEFKLKYWIYFLRKIRSVINLKRYIQVQFLLSLIYFLLTLPFIHNAIRNIMNKDLENHSVSGEVNDRL